MDINLKKLMLASSTKNEAFAVFNTFTLINQLGYESVRNQTSVRLFRRHTSILKKAGIL